jgi:DNA-directed RNA polymerase subunit L
MELELKKSSSTELRFVLKGERHTFPNLLRDALLKESSVEFAAYVLPHPLGNEAEFVVKTKGKNAKTVLQSALKSLGKELSEFEKAFKAAK